MTLASEAAWPAGDGEMARRIRAHDWASTPLGPLAGWPQSLKTVVDLMLASPGPVSVLWGAERIQLYNDAYIAVAEERHPRALGRRAAETWSDVYAQYLGPILDQVFSGRPLMMEDQSIPVRRAGGEGFEDRVFTAAFTPVRDETGAVGGVFHPLIETTARARSEEALRQSQARFRLIVEEAVDYAIFTTDVENRIDSWPPGAQAVFGWAPEEAIDQPADITFTPEDRAAGQPQKEFVTARDTGFCPDVRWHIRKDGERVFIEGTARPRHGPGGGFLGLFKIGRDATERHRVEQALQESEARFRQFSEASSDLLWIRNAETLEFEYVSPAFETLYGASRETVLTGNEVKSWAELVHPEDRQWVMESLRRLRGGERIDHEFRVVRPSDGQLRWIHNTDFPLLDEAGRVQRIAGIGKDVTEQRRAAEHQRMLLAELQHRVRNILAVVRSVARRSSGSSETVEDYAMHLDGRINALARTQAVLTRTPGEGVSLEGLISDELLAYAASDEQLSVCGPEVRLQPKAAETLGLAVHELATNAVKYGALSSERGRVAVAWTMAPDSEVPILRLEWRETGVSVVSSGPRRRGFGQELIERTVPYELGARAELAFEPGGVCCRIDMPMNERNLVPEGAVARGADLIRQPEKGGGAFERRGAV